MIQNRAVILCTGNVVTAAAKTIIKQNKSINIYPRLLKTFKNGEIGNDARWFDIDFIEADDNEIILSGDSAWSPCLQLFTKISNLYKSFKIHYEYEEQGSDFCGFAVRYFFRNQA